jgi:hypothetical protein
LFSSSSGSGRLTAPKVVALNVIQPIRQAWSNVVFSAMSMESIIFAPGAAARLAGAPPPQRQAVGSDRDLFSGFGS